MVAAKEKTLNIQHRSNIKPMDNKPAHPTATKTPSTVVNRISSYDFRTRKFKKSPIGSTEKIHLIVAVKNQQRREKTQGENHLQLRRSRWAPELSLYRAYFAPHGVDPEGSQIFVMTGTDRDSLPLKCGKRAHLNILFELVQNNCPNGGYLVQKVEVHKVITNCKVKCPDLIDPEDKTVKYNYEYYEWWSVRRGKKIPFVREVALQQRPDLANRDDRMSFTPQSDTQGAITQLRTLRFYCKGATGDLGRDDKPKRPWANGGHPDSGEVPSMKAPPAPGFWGKAPEAEFLYWTNGRWSCCPKQKQFVELTSEAPDGTSPGGE